MSIGASAIGNRGRLAAAGVVLLMHVAIAGTQESPEATAAADARVGEAEARERLERSKENQNRWLKLEWRSRTSVYLKEKRRATVEHEIAYELNGTFARTRVTPLGSVGTPGSFKSNFVGGKEEVALDWMDKLNDVVDLYFRVSPGQALDIMASAEVSDDTSEASSSRRIEAEGYAAPGDRVTLFIDAESDFPRALQVQTAFDEEPVTLQLEMRLIDGGVNVPSRAVVQVPGERVRMVVDFFDYKERSIR